MFVPENHADRRARSARSTVRAGSRCSSMASSDRAIASHRDVGETDLKKAARSGHDPPSMA